MESAIATLIVVSVIVLSVYLANYTKDSSSDSKSQKMNDILTFTLPFIATLVIGIAVIPDFIYLSLAITAALLAGVLSLLVSWTEEKKARQKSKRDVIEKAVKGIILIIERNCQLLWIEV